MRLSRKVFSFFFAFLFGLQAAMCFEPSSQSGLSSGSGQLSFRNADFLRLAYDGGQYHVASCYGWHEDVESDPTRCQRLASIAPQQLQNVITEFSNLEPSVWDSAKFYPRDFALFGSIPFLFSVAAMSPRGSQLAGSALGLAALIGLAAGHYMGSRRHKEEIVNIKTDKQEVLKALGDVLRVEPRAGSIFYISRTDHKFWAGLQRILEHLSSAQLASNGGLR